MQVPFSMNDLSTNYMLECHIVEASFTCVSLSDQASVPLLDVSRAPKTALTRSLKSSCWASAPIIFSQSQQDPQTVKFNFDHQSSLNTWGLIGSYYIIIYFIKGQNTMSDQKEGRSFHLVT